MVTNVGYANRLEALDQTWQVWAELGRKMTEAQWSSPTRCPGWDVAALYAHHSGFPVALSAPPHRRPGRPACRSPPWKCCDGSTPRVEQRAHWPRLSPIER